MAVIEIEVGVSLTPSETNVLKEMAEGLSNAQIGKKLWCAEDTVKTHVRAILLKLQARSRTHAVAIAFRAGLVE